MSRWIFLSKGEMVLSCLMDQERLVECRIDGREASFVGSIYSARVENLLPGLKAAFVSIGDRICYYSLKDSPEPVFIRRARPDRITVGDEILVQVEKDAIKTKEPAVRGVLQLSGRYGVVMYPETGIFFSRKLTDEAFRKSMRKALRHKLPEHMGVLIRTNAAAAPVDQVLEEIQDLAASLLELTAHAAYRNIGARLWSPMPEYLCILRDLSMSGAEEIVTDDEELYGEISRNLGRYPATKEIPCRYYKDSLFPLDRCYRIPVLLEKAMDRQVWLSSGAYLVIEQTEALTAVDVNTGKAEGGKKNTEDFLFRINWEAAAEIMAQIRLRNLSGIIILDFINMEEKEHQEELMEYLKRLAALDPIKTRIVDFTPLGLVEVTRKKEKDTLARQIERINLKW